MPETISAGGGDMAGILAQSRAQSNQDQMVLQEHQRQSNLDTQKNGVILDGLNKNNKAIDEGRQTGTKQITESLGNSGKNQRDAFQLKG
jgi:hypothetical protein